MQMEPSTSNVEDHYAVDGEQHCCTDCFAVKNRCQAVPIAKELNIRPVPPLNELLQRLLSDNQADDSKCRELISSLKHWLEAFDSDDPDCFEGLTTQYEFTIAANTTIDLFFIACCANRLNLMRYFLDKSGYRFHDLATTDSPGSIFHRHVIEKFYSLSSDDDNDKFKDLMEVFKACGASTVFRSILCKRWKYVCIDLLDLSSQQRTYCTEVSCVEVMIMENQKLLLKFIFEEFETIIDDEDPFLNLFADNENLTPLMFAAIFCDSDIIRTILAHLKKRQIPHRNRSDSSSLHRQQQQQQEQSGNYIGRRLKFNDFTAAHFAVCYNQADVIELLLESGGMEQTENRCGFPLALALSLSQTHTKIVEKCLSGQSDKVEALIEKLNDADVDSNREQTGVHCSVTERIENVSDDVPSSNTISISVVKSICNSVIDPGVFEGVDFDESNNKADDVMDFLTGKVHSPEIDRRGQRSMPKRRLGSLGSKEYWLEKMRKVHMLSTWLNLSEIELRWKSLLDNWSDGSKDRDATNPLNWTGHNGNSCLHVAARHNDHKLLSTLLQKIDGDTFPWYNDSRETALHTAVSHGHVESVRILAKQLAHRFIPGVDGQTKQNLLTLATEKDARNVLHIAAWDDRVDIIRIILSECDDELKRSLCDAGDGDGDTPLNLAVIQENLECVRALGQFSNANIANRKRHNALHLASETADTCLLLAVLETCHRPNDGMELDLDAFNSLGNTPLMICINNGHCAGVRNLLEHGADLEKAEGLNVAQLVAKNAAQNSEKMVAVWNAICEFAYETAIDEIIYARKPKDRVEILRGKTYRNARSILLRLTRTRVQSSTRANDEKQTSSDVTPEKQTKSDVTPQKKSGCELTALEVASRSGHADILKAMIECCSTFCNEQTKYYDFGGLVPLPGDELKSVHSSPSRPDRSSSNNNHSADQQIEMKSRSNHAAVTTSSSPASDRCDRLANNSSVLPARDSCLELIAKQSTDVIIQTLEIDPIKQFISKISMLRRFIFFLLLIFHIVHMSCFTQYVMPTCNIQPIADRLHNVSTSKATVTVRRLSYDPTFGLFLMWPAVIFLMEAAFLSKSLYRVVRDTRNRSQTDSDCVDQSDPPDEYLDILKLNATKMTDITLFHEFKYVSTLLEKIEKVHQKLTNWFSLDDTWQIDAVVSRVSRLGFCAIMAAWFGHYVTFSTNVTDDEVEDYATVTSVTLVFGWMLTLEYLRGIQLIYAFVTVVKTIFYRDVIRVMVIFGFIWLAFSCAMCIFITLVQTRSGSPATMTLTSAVYEMYNTMLGHGALYDWTNAWSGDWTLTLRNDTVVVFSLIYGVFLLLATIVLLNVLIAMMNSTYQEVLKISDSLWNVECVQLVEWMTRDNLFATKTIYYYFLKRFVFYRFRETVDVDNNAQSSREIIKGKVEENGVGRRDVTYDKRAEVTDVKVTGNNDERNRNYIWAMETSDLPPAVNKLMSKLFGQEDEQ